MDSIRLWQQELTGEWAKPFRTHKGGVNSQNKLKISQHCSTMYNMFSSSCRSITAPQYWLFTIAFMNEQAILWCYVTDLLAHYTVYLLASADQLHSLASADCSLINSKVNNKSVIWGCVIDLWLLLNLLFTRNLSHSSTELVNYFWIYEWTFSTADLFTEGILVRGQWLQCCARAVHRNAHKLGFSLERSWQPAETEINLRLFFPNGSEQDKVLHLFHPLGD